jgi:signal transduction histidine kinase
MKTHRTIPIRLPERLFNAGLTEAQLPGLVHRWCVIQLYKSGKIDAVQAGELLTTDRNGFLDMLESLDIVYTDPEPTDLKNVRVAPQLAQLNDAQQQLDYLSSILDSMKYKLFQTEQELAQADRVRSDFIATVSHELRTPLNSIIGFAKLLLNQQIGSLNEMQQTDLSLIYDSANHLLSLVNDILDLSKIEAGKISLDMNWVSVAEIVVGVVASTYILLEDKPIELVEHFEPGLPLVFADRDRIRQVVINILSNAAKFTDKGTITLKVAGIERENHRFVCFSVADTGIGIKPEDLNKVFEPFRQVDSSESRRAGGTGLGMPISYRLIQLHSGEMWVESTPGCGSTFSFTLPVRPPESDKARTVHADYRLG